MEEKHMVLSLIPTCAEKSMNIMYINGCLSRRPSSPLYIYPLFYVLFLPQTISVLAIWEYYHMHGY
jgi:hypothetical protein